jgi:spore coat protein U-like protein
MIALRLRRLRHAAQLALALMCIIAASEASAAYSCTLSVSPITIMTVYSPSVVNDTVGSFTMNCTRLATDANTMNYTVRANYGNNAAGAQRRVNYNPPGPGSYFYNYGLHRNTGCNDPWGNAGTDDFDQNYQSIGPLNFGTSLTASRTLPFCLRLPVDNSPTPAGTYTDTVTISLNPQGPGNTVTAPLPVSVITTDSCQITVAPGNVNFTYTSFQGAASNASTSYGVRCTLNFAYGMSLDATSGTLLGLNYTLAVPATSTGTGLTQTHTINGSIAAGQSGTCATAVCNGTQTRTLTVSW